MLGYVPGGSRTYNFDQSHAAGSIDSYIFADLQTNGITPAPRTTDWEFIRRVTLDLTGRIPTPDRVLTFVADTRRTSAPSSSTSCWPSRSGSTSGPCIFGDLYQNTDTKPSTGLQPLPAGRNAFYHGFKDSLSQQAVQPDGDRADRGDGRQHLQRRARQLAGGRRGHRRPRRRTSWTR